MILRQPNFLTNTINTFLFLFLVYYLDIGEYTHQYKDETNISNEH